MRKAKKVTVTVVSWSSWSCSKSDCSKECVTDPHACDCGMESIYVSVNMKLWNTCQGDGAGEVLVWPGQLSLDSHLSGSAKWIWTYCRTWCCWKMFIDREVGQAIKQRNHPVHYQVRGKVLWVSVIKSCTPCEHKSTSQRQRLSKKSPKPPCFLCTVHLWSEFFLKRMCSWDLLPFCKIKKKKSVSQDWKRREKNMWEKWAVHALL